MEKKEQNASICSIESKKEEGGELRSRVFSFNDNFSWDGIKAENYKQDAKSWQNIVRSALVGNKGEFTKFHLRYFEVEKGGYSSLERHEHEHVVVVIRGEGSVRLGKEEVIVKPFDVIYIKPNEAHQLRNSHKEPFGFLCIVDAVRDVPKIIDEKELALQKKE